MAASYPTKMALAFRSGNKCANPACGCVLTEAAQKGDKVAVIGEAAHIAGEKPSSPRYDPNMTDQERNGYPNLIYMCPNCHSTIDTLVEDYPTELLLRMKSEHENKVMESIEASFAEVGFPELEIAASAVSEQILPSSENDYTVLDPEAKIAKNGLSSASKKIVTMGLALSREVSEFVAYVVQDDPGFPDRLKSGFLTEYYRLVSEGVSGDELFDMMCQFAQRGIVGQAKKAAGLALLCYLFEKCEVFEK